MRCLVIFILGHLIVALSEGALLKKRGSDSSKTFYSNSSSAISPSTPLIPSQPAVSSVVTPSSTGTAHLPPPTLIPSDVSQVSSGRSSARSSATQPSTDGSNTNPGATTSVPNLQSTLPTITSTGAETAPSTTYATASVSITSISGVTTDSHTSTVGSNGHTTLIPIVGGSHCWFCPPAIDIGFGLFGMSLPGVYPPGPAPPGFPSPLPAITVGQNGDPSYSDEESKPTSTGDNASSSSPSSTSSSSPPSTTSCPITETASMCSETVSYGVNTVGSTTATSTITTCTPITSCGIAGTTGTAVITSSESGTCYRFPDATPSSSAVKRDVENKQTESPTDYFLFSRARDKGFDEFGNCKLGFTLNYPTYPGPPKIVDFMKKKSLALKGAYIVPLACEKAPELVLSNFDSLDKQTYNDVQKRKYAPMGGTAQPFANTEHVYELQILPAFLSSLITDNKISCDDFKTKFLTNDESNGVLEKLFEQLPSWTYPDFIVLDNTVNDYKGKIFNLQPRSLSGRPKTSEKIKELYNLAMVFDMMRTEDVYTKFQTSNARIYQYLQDTFDACGPAPAGGWAPAYTSFMSSYVSAQASSASTIMTARYTQASTHNKNTDAENTALKQLTERYPTASWNFDIANLLSWPAAAKVKRTACTPTATPSSSAGPTTTATQTTATETTTTPTMASPTTSTGETSQPRTSTAETGMSQSVTTQTTNPKTSSTLITKTSPPSTTLPYDHFGLSIATITEPPLATLGTPRTITGTGGLVTECYQDLDSVCTCVVTGTGAEFDIITTSLSGGCYASTYSESLIVETVLVTASCSDYNCT